MGMGGPPTAVALRRGAGGRGRAGDGHTGSLLSAELQVVNKQLALVNFAASNNLCIVSFEMDRY